MWAAECFFKFNRKKKIIRPSSLSQSSIRYPTPTWAYRACKISTESCAGHGACTSTGVCVCNFGYYGRLNSLSCDSLCNGQVDSLGNCLVSKLYYIGGVSPMNLDEGVEYVANMKMAVELINNKTSNLSKYLFRHYFVFDNNISPPIFVVLL